MIICHVKGLERTQITITQITITIIILTIIHINPYPEFFSEVLRDHIIIRIEPKKLFFTILKHFWNLNTSLN